MVVQLLKNPPTMQETRVQFLGQEDPLAKEIATYSNMFAWEIPADRGFVNGVASVEHNLATKPTPP